MSSVKNVGQANGAGAAAPAANGGGAAILHELNPQLGQLIEENPGVGKLIAKWENMGAIIAPKPSDATSSVTYQMWTHSKKSGGMPVEPFKDIIVVYQKGPGSPNLGIGGGAAGTVIGVFRLDQFAFPSAAAAQKANPKLKVVEFQPGKFLHISDDKSYVGSYEWADMQVNAYGAAGKKFELGWCIVGVANDGRVMGGGYEGGYSGRTTTGTFGKNQKNEMPDH